MLTTNSSLMDGINRHILTLAPVLNKMSSIEVAVCTVMPSGDLNVLLEGNGVQCYSLDCPHGHDWHIIPRFFRVVTKFRPSVIHVHVLAMMEKILCATIFRKKKYVCTVHGISDKVEHYTMRIRLETLLDKLFHVPYSATCYVSEGVRKTLALQTQRTVNSCVIYNPIKFSEVESSTYALHQLIGVDMSVPIIGTSCRIAYVKNPQLFTEVMCKVLMADDAVHAVVMGDGDKEMIEECRKVVGRYGVDNRFHWLGYRKDAPILVRNLSCFVMTSRSEGLPTSLLECMATKTPFAFLKGTGGLIDIAQLNEHEGVFAVTADYGEWEKLADGIIKLVHDAKQSQTYANRAYDVGKKYFSVEQVAGKLAELYKRINKIS